MSSEIFSNDSLALNQSLNYFQNESNASVLCTFQQVKSIWNFIELFEHRECYRHSMGFTVFLCVANLLILMFGLVGNFLVIYVVAVRIKAKTASSLFILNLAIADLLVILCCIPATLIANLFMPWVFGDVVCKVVAYSQGVSVFCSVYSLVAISFDRFRAIHDTLGVTLNMTAAQALKIILVIWAIGIAVTLPWALVFAVIQFNPYAHELSTESSFLYEAELPFCREGWPSRTYDLVYFLVIHVIACFLLPFGMITVFNVLIWKSVLSTGQSTGASNSPKSSTATNYGSRSSNIQELQRKRKLRILKMFTGLTFLFFVFWLPLYAIMFRVKFFYTQDYIGSQLEQRLIPILIPIAQLLGSCNSCVNPVLYALLNQKLRKNFRQLFARPKCWLAKKGSTSATVRNGSNSVAVVVAENVQVQDTAM